MGGREQNRTPENYSPETLNEKETIEPKTYQSCYNLCTRQNVERGPCDGHIDCKSRCRRQYSKKEGVKVASYGNQSYFDLLEELKDTEDDFFEQLLINPLDKNATIDAPPLMLAVDYDTCVKCCIDEGYSSSECHRSCEE